MSQCYNNQRRDLILKDVEMSAMEFPIIRQFLIDNVFKMLKSESGVLTHAFIDPGAGYDYNLWDWDSYFACDAMLKLCAYCKNDEKFDYQGSIEKVIMHGKGCVLNFLDLQLQDGFIPMACTDKKGYAEFLYMAHENGEPVNQHKPFLAQNALNLCEATGDYSWFDIEKLVKYIDYYYANQYHEKSGLFFWQDDVMIGIDNNPTVFGRPDKSTADIFLNCFVYAELKALSKILLHKGDERAEEYSEKAENLKIAINENMFDEKDGIYYSLDVGVHTNQKYVFHKGLGVFWKGLPIKIRFWACFLPMMFGISDERQNRLLLAHIRDKNFECDYGIRTLAKDEKMFNEELTSNPSNWLGSIWIIANYCVWKGLKRSGFEDEAKNLAQKTIKLLADDIVENGVMSESYNSETGKRQMHGGFLNWNCLVIEMMADIENR